MEHRVAHRYAARAATCLGVTLAVACSDTSTEPRTNEPTESDCCDGGGSSIDAGRPVDDAARLPDAGETPPPMDAPLVPSTVRFEKITLHRTFYCEGAANGDIDGDGTQDVIAGPHWYAGPDFGEAHEIWSPVPADPYAYSSCFFQWSHDFDGDDDTDVLVVGFPGEAAFWYENPGAGVGTWARHLVAAMVDNESP